MPHYTRGMVDDTDLNAVPGKTAGRRKTCEGSTEEYGAWTAMGTLRNASLPASL
jgi:hypothetical protein